MLFYQKHTKHFKISPGHSRTTLNCQNDRLPVCTKQDLAMKGEYHLTVNYLTLDVYQVCHCVGRCACQNGSCSSSIKPGVKVSGQYWRGILLSQRMLDAINDMFSSSNLTRQCTSASCVEHSPTFFWAMAS